MDRLDDKAFHQITRALADPQRFALLQRIARESEVPCTVLVEESPITHATISHHLKGLSNAGLVHVRRAGKCAFFSLNTNTMTAYQAELARRVGGLTSTQPPHLTLSSTSSPMSA
jgi:ArsR family transcriptional regulator, arsenate/arsenite/antimonite-responsive transcriptional repressor